MMSSSTTSSTFIRKPTEKLISKQGVTYPVKYVGCIEVKVSMKTLNFKTRSNVAKECINRVCEAAGMKLSNDKRRKIDKKVQRAIADTAILDNSGVLVNLNVSSSNLTLVSVDNDGIIIVKHDMPHISFASGGDSDTQDFIGYVAKDLTDWRACYVLECGGSLTKDVIATIGQAFDLRYEQYMKPIQLGLSMGQPMVPTGGDADKDYYNDLPGKIPPDMGPPPVPPLPTSVPPFTTLPPIPIMVATTPNLIDFNTDSISFDATNHHDYVNDNMINAREKDLFDMHPFGHEHKLSICNVGVMKTVDDHLTELHDEIWFHGQITRAEAEELLQTDGDFLVRESPNSTGQFVLSGIQQNIKKHLLLIDPDGIIRTKDRLFNSVSHLINYHCENALPIISAESVLLLRTPVARSK